MMVVYHDIGGSHSSAVAAHIHVNNLPADTVPDKNAILTIPTFDRIEKKDRGRLILVGEDEMGNKVYTLSRQYAEKIVVPAIRDMYNILKNTSNNEGLYLVNTSPSVSNLMAIGGFLSRRFGLVRIGRPIVTYGTLKAYNDIARIVLRVKKIIKDDLKEKFIPQ